MLIAIVATPRRSFFKKQGDHEAGRPSSLGSSEMGCFLAEEARTNGFRAHPTCTETLQRREVVAVIANTECGTSLAVLVH